MINFKTLKTSNYLIQNPSLEPTIFQKRKKHMKYGMFIHFGINTFLNQEWTDGTHSPLVYSPTDINADQWIKTAWEAGMNYVILVTKHHEGFSLWDSKYTDYSVTNSNNKTDVIKEVSEACKKYGIKLGLYYSLWDRNWDLNNGKENNEEYVQYMLNQLEELMDGRYGEIVELWLDGSWEKKPEEWGLDKVYSKVKSLQPGCQISVNLTLGKDYFPEQHSEGAEIVYFPSDFRLYDPFMTNKNYDPKIFSYKGDSYYLPFESTQCLKSTWFYHTNNDTEDTRQSIESIKEMHDQLVGQENTFVLNVCPNRQGQLLNNDISTLKNAASLMGIRRCYDSSSDNHGQLVIKYLTENGDIADTTEILTAPFDSIHICNARDLSNLGYELISKDSYEVAISEPKTEITYLYKDLTK